MINLSTLLQEIDTSYDKGVKQLIQQVKSINWKSRIKYNKEEGYSQFKSTGISGVECYGFAKELQLIFGKNNVKIYGFFEDENPTSQIAQEAGGHDFAVYKNRFILDPWIRVVEGISKREVFDMLNPKDKAVIEKLYGDRKAWKLATDD